MKPEQALRLWNTLLIPDILNILQERYPKYLNEFEQEVAIALPTVQYPLDEETGEIESIKTSNGEWVDDVDFKIVAQDRDKESVDISLGVLSVTADSDLDGKNLIILAKRKILDVTSNEDPLPLPDFIVNEMKWLFVSGMAYYYYNDANRRNEIPNAFTNYQDLKSELAPYGIIS